MSPRRLHQVALPRELALLAGAPRKGSRDARRATEHLDELARLADTAGAAVAGRVVQLVSSPDPHFYIGKGKVEEVRSRVAAAGATMLIFDEELSPSQGRHLEEALGVRVMDRTELILDIFALRARSHEARTQVELAQLQYLVSRLTRMWVHLSRIRGGIGLRGPGETQLETDRRAIRHRIGRLKKDLAQVTEHRARTRARSRERDVLRVALVGYTNAGKSSLLRALTRAEAHVEDRLFATLDTLSRETVLAGTRVRFTDTVGFIRKLPHDLVASFRATLEEALDADVLLHVVDAAHAAWEDQARVVDAALEEAGVSGERRVVVALNKADRLGDEERADRLASARDRGWEALLVSATTRDGLEELSRGLTSAATS